MLFIEHLLELEPLWLQKLPQAIGSSMVKNLPANAADARDTGLARVRKMPWSRKWQPTLVFLAWKTPWTEESGELQSMGSQRVEHDLATKQQQQNIVLIIINSSKK